MHRVEFHLYHRQQTLNIYMELKEALEFCSASPVKKAVVG